MLISLAIGFVYNKILDNYKLNSFWSFNFSSRLLVFALILTFLGVMSYLFIRNFHPSFDLKHKSLTNLVIAVFFVTIVLGVLWYGGTHYLGSILINSLIIALVLPVIIYIILETQKYRYGLIAVLAEVILSTVIMGALFGMQFALYCLLILNFVTIICVKDMANIKKQDKQCFVVGLIGASVVLVFVTLFILFPTTLLERQYDFCHQEGIVEYDAIKNVILNAKLVNLDLSNEFLDEVNTIYGCTYTHLLEIFGVIPLALFCILQLSSVIIMGIVSQRAKQNAFLKSILWFCTGTIGFQLLAGLSSSFLLMPISEFGGLFLTLGGMEFGIVPMMVFLLLAFNKSTNHQNGNPTKIVIAGGPCSGKTSVIKELKKRINPKYSSKVKFIDEVANAVLIESPLASENRIEFQKTIFARQKEEEEKIDVNIEVIISDRGKADAYVYLSDEEVKSIGDLANLNQVLSEYNAVIYLEKRDNTYLKKDDDTIRVENNSEEAEIVTTRTKEVWMQHNNVICIEPFNSIEEKAEYVAKQINKICQIDIFE